MKERGWIRIVEAFTMILLMTGIFLVVTERNSNQDVSQKIYESEQEVLRVIQLNNSLREDVFIFSSSSLPIEMSNFTDNLNNSINSTIPNYLNCYAKICEINDECTLTESVEKNIYTQEVLISSSLDNYDPRKLKLFCWVK